jgi:methylated-DNA-[protein]-cysteine S-methyltransferase
VLNGKVGIQVFDRFVIHHLTPIGWLTLVADHEALMEVHFGQTIEPRGYSPVLDQAIKELDQYFAGHRTDFSVRFKTKGTPFQQKVWGALARIPYGAIPSYSDIADDIGRPSAVRAVGMANNKNPIPVFIPCHRVIGRDGSLVGYAGGLEVKRKLLDLELRVSSGMTTELRRDRPATLQLFQ